MKKTLLTLTFISAALALVGAADEKDFHPLFNGKDTNGWHLRNANGHNSWTVKDGVLKNTVKPGEHETDLVTDQKFWNFTVKFDYLVPDNSNSGFYLRGRHELQILGDHASGTNSPVGNGALYNFKAPDKFVSRPGDEWQTVEATISGSKITVVLNGVTVHDHVECNQATGGQLDDKVDQPGQIFLQGDHGTVSFRNLRIKELN